MTERRAQDEKQNQRIFIKNKKQKSIQSHSRPNVCLIDFRACIKFIPRFKTFNHYKCVAMLCSSACGSAVWRLMNEKQEMMFAKKEKKRKKNPFYKCLFIQLLNSLTHDIANLRNSRKRSTLVTNAIEVTTCRISAHKTDRTEKIHSVSIQQRKKNWHDSTMQSESKQVNKSRQKNERNQIKRRHGHTHKKGAQHAFQSDGSLVFSC